jgi:osmotically-inducible protein OsmY
MLGCAHTEPGQSRNVQINEIAYKGQGLVHRAKEDFRDTTDALSITPRVKGAIIADSQLNDRRNHINVDTKDYVLHLKGHVYSQAIKSRAGRIAARKLKEMHKNYRVSNELSIMRH